MAEEFEVDNSEEFERMISNGDIRINRALVRTVLKNLKSKKRHHHALSVICINDGEIYDVTIDKKDFQHTLETTLPKYEKEELYEDCSKIVEALEYLKKNKKK
jgi:cytidylate kinase